MAGSVDEYEKDDRPRYYPDTPAVTEESAIVGIEVNSMAGSGIGVFADVGDAIRWFRQACEDMYGDDWIPDRQAPAELREGRQRFRALLARFSREGYTPDMGEELRNIVASIQSDDDVIPAYAVGGVTVLPGDLDAVLEGWWGDPGDEDEVADLVLDGGPVPPFDLSNPAHFAKLKARLESFDEV